MISKERMKKMVVYKVTIDKPKSEFPDFNNRILPI